MVTFNYSVVIPTHNRVHLLDGALRSVFSQSIRPHEIFVVDDLGMSVVQKLIEGLNKEFNFNIRYIVSNSKNGVSYSYNLGASHASAEYLAFLDDDDFWGEDYIDYVADTIMYQNPDMVLTRLTEYDDQCGVIRGGKCPPQCFDVKLFYLRNPGVLRSNLVIRRSCFELAEGYDEKILGSSDKELFMRLKALRKTHFVLDRLNLVYWRTSHKSQASTNHKKMLGNVRKFYRKYFFSMPLDIHIKMSRKMLFLYIKIIKNKLKYKDGSEVIIPPKLR